MCVCVYGACVAYGVPACARAPRQNTLAAPECMFESRLSFRCSRGKARTCVFFNFFILQYSRVELVVCLKAGSALVVLAARLEPVLLLFSTRLTPHAKERVGL